MGGGSEEDLIGELVRRLRESTAGLMRAEPDEDPLALTSALDEAAQRARTPIRRACIGSRAEIIVWLRADDARLLRDPELVIVGVRA